MNGMTRTLRVMTAVSAVMWTTGMAAFGEVPPQIFKPGSFVLFQGDSITHGGRAGDMNHYLGHGYQAEIAMRYLAYRPEDNLQFANRGKSGDTSSKIWDRWQTEGITVKNVEGGYRNAFGIKDEKDLLVRPDYVSLLCGVNDRAFWKCDANFFRKHMTLILESLVASNKNVKIILGEPFRAPMSNDPEFFKIQAAVAEFAAKYGVPCVKYQKLFNETLPKIVGRDGYWSWDSVHPTYPAHMKMADLWIDTVSGFYAKPETNTALVPRGKLEQDSYDWYVRHTNVIEVQRGYTKAGKSPDVVFIGDSITHFWGSAVDGAQAQPRWKKAFGAWTTLNAGFGWDRTQNVLWRLDHGLLDGISPKAVAIMIGTNNIGGTGNAPANTAEEIFAAICRIVERVREKCPKTKVVLSNVLPRGEKPTEIWRTKGQAVNKLLKAKFAGDAEVAYIEVYDEFLAADGLLTKEIMPDATHPSDKGYDIWAAKLVPELAKCVK